MSGICVAAERPSNAWRQRGFTDGLADREARPPKGEEEARAYMGGHRSGIARRASLQAEKD